MRGVTSTLLVLQSSLLLAASCGGSGSQKEDIGACGPRWNVLLESSGNLGRIGFGSSDRSDLIWSNDRLYFLYYDKMATPPGQVLASLVTASDGSHPLGDIAKLPQAQPLIWWWIEDQQLTYIGNDWGLYGVPLDGSEQPKLLTKFPPFEQHLYTFALDSEALYWTAATAEYYPEGPWGLWRASRTTGERIQLASLPASSYLLGSPLVLASDRILFVDGQGLGGGTNTLYAVPKTGGDPQVLSTSTKGWVLGVAEDGSALWEGPSSSAHKLWRSDGHGGAQVPVWPDIPEEESATEAWSDGSGGWYVATTTWFENPDVQAASVWRLDSQGQATRLTCNLPPTERATLSGTLSPSTLYLLQSDEDFRQSRSIVSIAR